MKIFRFLSLIGILAFGASESWAVLSQSDYEFICSIQSEFELKDHVCRCSANQKMTVLLNDEIENCRKATQIQRWCKNYPDLHLEMIHGRCFCPFSRKYLTPSISMDLDSSLEVLQAEFKTGIDECERKKKELGILAEMTGAMTVFAWDPGILSFLGHPQYLITRYSPRVPWLDMSDRIVAQGDPRDPLERLGDQLGFALGYLQLNSQTLMVPSIDHLNRAIFLINRRILKNSNFRGSSQWDEGMILIQFYPVEGEVSVDDFISRFAKSLEIPLAKFNARGSQHFYVHDGTYHIASWVLMPYSLVRHYQEVANDLIAFRDFVKTSYPNEFSNYRYRRFFEGLFTGFVAGLDRLGNIVINDFGNPISTLKILDTVKQGFNTGQESDFPSVYSRKALLLHYRARFGGWVKHDQKTFFQIFDKFLEKREKDSPGLDLRFSIVDKIDSQADFTKFFRAGELFNDRTQFLRKVVRARQ